jgi:hypothetical protein
VAINQKCDEITDLIDKKDREESLNIHNKVSFMLDKLTPDAEGEIQERSVENLSFKLKALLTLIEKIKPVKTPRSTVKSDPIVWNEKRLEELSTGYLSKVVSNMGEDKKAAVCFSTAGKGIRPSYQIEFANQDVVAFSGSDHTPLKRRFAAGSSKMSEYFSHSVIGSILVIK